VSATFAGLLYAAEVVQEVRAGMFALCTLMAIRRMYQWLLTIAASVLATMFFNIAQHLLPKYNFDEKQFFRADGAPEEIAELRKQSLMDLANKWEKERPKSMKLGSSLRGSLSDIRFMSARTFLPFQQYLMSKLNASSAVLRTEGPRLYDVDGFESIDVSGSYGVNVVGYDRYKEWITKGWSQVEELGCVLGTVHPLLHENLDMLKKISGKDEVSFHMSGTEAVMCAVRLARFNTGRKLIVQFGGSYHGWWDGVQTLAGNERQAHDVLTFNDCSSMSLAAIGSRSDEIAAILVNPLQCFHVNQPPPSDVTLMSNIRNCHENTAYGPFLKELRKLCDRTGIQLLFDEVYTGFRLAPGGAQEYFGVQADIVTYGKTLGGGIPNGVCCGPRKIMARNDPSKPLRVAYVIGTFAAHPLLLASMNGFLRWVTSPEAKQEYSDNRNRVNKFITDTNALFLKENIPLTLTSYSTVWTMIFTIPGRYHWMLQYYMKDEGINLSWVGTGRCNFSLDFTDKHMSDTQERMLRACKRMKEGGWWHPASAGTIKFNFISEVVGAALKRCVGM
jgi:glutamate-1-semialdehyde 2,1-aminomutase